VAIRRITPQAYRRWTLAALVFLSIIILTGAAVRLTASGLGCSRWPQCEKGTLVGAANGHQAIEQINRLFTGLMAVAIMGALAGSLLRNPRRKDLTRLSLSLVVGFLLQGVVGGILVLSHLHPIALMAHFLLSAVVLVASLVLHQRAGEDTARSYRPTVPESVRSIVRACAALGVIVIVSGTVVTGTGPHSGSLTDKVGKVKPVKRFGFHLDSVARVHSILVMVLIGLVLFLYWKIRGTPAWTLLEDRLTAVLFALFVQGGIGYAQYFTKLPVGLVAAHVAGATIVVITLTRLVLKTREAVAVETAIPPSASLVAQR
jgi:heme a synthase